MDTYEQITLSFSSLPCVGDWDEILKLFRRVAAQKPAHWLLPIRACQAVGGTLEQAIPAAVAIACSHLSIILVDDMLDGDPRGTYRQSGEPAAANMACSLQAAALAAIARCDATPASRLAALGSMNQMILTTTLGQYWDVQRPADEVSYWRVVRTKSSPFFGTALQVGALLGGGSFDVAEHLKDFGALYGEMIQIHDDLNDSMEVPANPDWLQQRYPLPILFARSVRHPARARFIKLCQNISKPDALREAQDILIHCGAVSYCVNQLLLKHSAMQTLLNDTPLYKNDAIEALADAVIAPVLKLFEQLETA